jgi:hypothetical protein
MEQTPDVTYSENWESIENLSQSNEDASENPIIIDDTPSAFLFASNFPADPLLYSVGPQDSEPISPTIMPFVQHVFPSVWSDNIQQPSASHEDATGRQVGVGPGHSALSSSSYASPSPVGDSLSPRSTSTSSARFRKSSLRGKKKEQ